MAALALRHALEEAQLRVVRPRGEAGLGLLLRFASQPGAQQPRDLLVRRRLGLRGARGQPATQAEQGLQGDGPEGSENWVWKLGMVALRQGVGPAR